MLAYATHTIVEKMWETNDTKKLCVWKQHVIERKKITNKIIKNGTYNRHTQLIRLTRQMRSWRRIRFFIFLLSFRFISFVFFWTVHWLIRHTHTLHFYSLHTNDKNLKFKTMKCVCSGDSCTAFYAHWASPCFWNKTNWFEPCDLPNGKNVAFCSK